MKNKLEVQKEAIVKNLDKDELKQYINQLAKRYYVTFINNNIESHNSINNDFNDIVSLFEDTYPNIKNYITYSLLKSANDLLQMSFPKNFILRCPNSIDIDEEKSYVIVNLLERVKAKRKELDDLKNENKFELGDS